MVVAQAPVDHADVGYTEWRLRVTNQVLFEECRRLRREVSKQQARAEHAERALTTMKMDADFVGTPSRWRHTRRDTTYELLGSARLQTSAPLLDNAELEIYRADKDGSLWARARHEFHDGRFEKIDES